MATQTFFVFIPIPGENDPIFTSIFFQKGLVQPPTRQWQPSFCVEVMIWFNIETLWVWGVFLLSSQSVGFCLLCHYWQLQSTICVWDGNGNPYNPSKKSRGNKNSKVQIPNKKTKNKNIPKSIFERISRFFLYLTGEKTWLPLVAWGINIPFVPPRALNIKGVRCDLL